MQQLDPESVATGITEILDREDLQTISESGRQLIEDEYSFEAAVRRYETILSGLCTD